VWSGVSAPHGAVARCRVLGSVARLPCQAQLSKRYARELKLLASVGLPGLRCARLSRIASSLACRQARRACPGGMAVHALSRSIFSDSGAALYPSLCRAPTRAVVCEGWWHRAEARLDTSRRSCARARLFQLDLLALP